MAALFLLSCLFVVGSNVVLSEDTMDTKLEVFRDGVKDWLDCYKIDDTSSCLEERTARKVHEVTSSIRKEFLQYFVDNKRLGKMVSNDPTVYSKEEVEEMRKLEEENASITEKIKGKESKPNGIVDELSDLFTYGVAKLLGYFSPGRQSDEELTEEILQASDRSNAVEARGHKKKYLKKQNKHLKIILLMMLFKNKVKMFMQKLQVLLQLKFLGIAVLNLLINLARLWLEIKKKKPHKVVYYENAHHQHHYDHEHVHDEGHGSYSHPGSHSHYSHHEEDYGGGPWPWSRSYIEKQSEQAFQALNTQNKPNTAAHNIVYLKQRPVR